MRSIFGLHERLVRTILILSLFLALGSPSPTALAQQLPDRGLVKAVDANGMTVSDMDRSVEFYSKVLSFENISDIEVWGSEYEHPQGIFGLRMRIVRMRLGDEFIELTEYLTPKGRPIPVDSRSHDRWFQHIAIIANDLVHWQTRLTTHDTDAALGRLRAGKFAFVSPGVVTLEDRSLGFTKGFLARAPEGHVMQLIEK